MTNRTTFAEIAEYGPQISAAAVGPPTRKQRFGSGIEIVEYHGEVTAISAGRSAEPARPTLLSVAAASSRAASGPI
jgi:hypothetical protein